MLPPAQWFSDKIPPWFRLPSQSTFRHVFYGILIGFSLSMTTSSLLSYYRAQKEERDVSRFEPRPIELRRDEVLSGVTGLIGEQFQMANHVVLIKDGKETRP